MPSSQDDKMTPSFADASDLLREVNAASERLAVSDHLPDDVAALVDRFDSLFHARNPEVRFASADPYLVEGLLGGAVVCLKALRHEDPGKARGAMRLGLEQVRQALRDMLDEDVVRADRPAKELVRWLAETLSVPQIRLAEILHVAPRTLQRWLSASDTTSPTGDDEMRVAVVARIVGHLRHAFTGPGAIRWLQRPHPQLGGRPPASLLGDVATFPELVHLAARARSMVAS